MNGTLEQLTGAVREIAGGLKVDHCVTEKNNGNKRAAVLVEVKAGLMASIYVDKLLIEIEDGRMTMAEAAEQVMTVYNQNRNDSAEVGRVDLEEITSKKFILENVHRRLVNTEMNKEMLKSCPHKDFLDLSITYAITLPQAGEYASTVRISNELLQVAGINPEELDEQAKANDRREWINMDMDMMLKDLGFIDPARSELGLVVASNRAKYYGASVMADIQYMQFLYDLIGEDFYILPSSVHECLMFPASMSDNMTYLRMVIHSVNTTEVDNTDILSDTLYKYNSITRSVEIAA